jgi:hypothetical protein
MFRGKVLGLLGGNWLASSRSTSAWHGSSSPHQQTRSRPRSGVRSGSSSGNVGASNRASAEHGDARKAAVLAHRDERPVRELDRADVVELRASRRAAGQPGAVERHRGGTSARLVGAEPGRDRGAGDPVAVDRERVAVRARPTDVDRALGLAPALRAAHLVSSRCAHDPSSSWATDSAASTLPFLPASWGGTTRR